MRQLRLNYKLPDYGIETSSCIMAATSSAMAWSELQVTRLRDWNTIKSSLISDFKLTSLNYKLPDYGIETSMASCALLSVERRSELQVTRLRDYLQTLAITETWHRCPLCLLTINIYSEKPLPPQSHTLCCDSYHPLEFVDGMSTIVDNESTKLRLVSLRHDTGVHSGLY